MEQIIANLLADFEQGRMTRRQLVQSLAAAAATLGGTGAAMAQAQTFKAVQLNHVSYMVNDYKVTRDFYKGLFGTEIFGDNDYEAHIKLGDSELAIGKPDKGFKPGTVDHIGLTIAGWDEDKSVPEKFFAEAQRRGIKARKSGGNGSPGSYSVHIVDPDGYDIQVGGKIQGVSNSLKSQGKI